MLEQTFSTVCISENKTVVRIFRKISEKFEYFFLFLKHFKRIHSALLYPIFKATISLKISFREKGLFKKVRRTNRFFQPINDRRSVIKHQTSSFKVGSMVSLRDLLVIS